MLLKLFLFVILKNAMAFVYAYCFSDFLCFDMSLLLLPVTLRGYLISIAYCCFIIGAEWFIRPLECQKTNPFCLGKIAWFLWQPVVLAVVGRHGLRMRSR